MPTRLVLGAASGSGVLVERLAERGDVLVVVAEGVATLLSDRGVPVERADPTDPDALAGLGVEPVGVVLATDEARPTVRSANAAREAFPDAAIVAPYWSAPGETAPAAADAAIDPGRAVASRVLNHVAGDAGERAISLRAALLAVDEPLAVLMHDNPDPDAIASAVALVAIADAFGVEAEPCYFGAIAHQENRALVNLLDLDLRQLDDPDELAAYGGVALVDHARPGVNDQLPADTDVDLVIDHHPTHGPDEAAFVDLRSGVGATSTLLTEYFDRLGVELTRTVATALLYGLRVDTDDFAREVSVADFEAAATLVTRADATVLERVESPSLGGDTMEVLARAIERRRRTESVLTAFVGEVHQRDALAQAADRLLDLEGVSTTAVFGVLEGTVHVSARARGAAVDLGDVLRAAFDQLGSAGGHADMAGAQIPVGMLIEEGDEDPMGIVEEVLTVAFLEAIETAYAPAAGEYAAADGELSFLATPGNGQVVRRTGEPVEEFADRLGATLERAGETGEAGETEGADEPESAADPDERD